jgi:hypothetical protein
MTTMLIIIASVITGIIVGGWLTLVIATAAMARSQQYMEKRVRFWQAQARAAADEPAMEWARPDYWPGTLTRS